MRLSHWRLAPKFNLVFLVVFALSLTVAGYVFNSLLQQQARQVVMDNARLMMANALAIRKYTSSEIKPVLSPERNGKFVPQTVPAYSATKSFEFLRTHYPDYYYKEAVLNPTNPNDIATPLEKAIVERFAKNDKLTEFVGYRSSKAGQFLYLAKPLRVSEQSCLQCHSTPAVAPPAMVRDYGSKRGFGWQLHGVIGAQVVTVPLALPERVARRITGMMLVSLAAVLLLTLIILNFMLREIVVAPVKNLAHLADEISKGHIGNDELKVNGVDEIAVLSASFNRMQRSLREAIKMLEE